MASSKKEMSSGNDTRDDALIQESVKSNTPNDQFVPESAASVPETAAEISPAAVDRARPILQPGSGNIHLEPLPPAQRYHPYGPPQQRTPRQPSVLPVVNQDQPDIIQERYFPFSLLFSLILESKPETSETLWQIRLLDVHEVSEESPWSIGLSRHSLKLMEVTSLFGNALLSLYKGRKRVRMYGSSASQEK
jgi:hypothetical protein